MRYIKELDSLRGIAVLFVIVSHWLSADSPINYLPNGPIGVNIFFVLSGFLITGILLGKKRSIEKDKESPWIALKKFYIRRSLRIFPIYYLTLLLLFIFRRSFDYNFNESWLYLLTYTTNFYFIKIQQWDGVISHLWSLAIEEQYYLLFPLTILFTSKKYLPYVIATFIITGFASQLLLSDIKMKDQFTITCFDAFGLGAILAWQYAYLPDKTRIVNRYLMFGAIVSLVLFVIGLEKQMWPFIPLRTLVSIITLFIISYILKYQESSNPLMSLFKNRALVFIGKISYGMYLYHPIFPIVIQLKFFDSYINPFIPDVFYSNNKTAIVFVENFLILTAISYLSYIIIEKYFLHLKNKYA
ncbi:MAG: acyltransferase [Bacteroidetes bacterium]|nr:acyltransferase [Bacteroidota bacterium]